MAIIEYMANFCDSGICFNEQHRCIYPTVKSAPLESMFGDQLDYTKPILKCKIELEARDKFHVYYPETATWHGTCKIAGHTICKFSQPCDHNWTYFKIEFECPHIIEYMQETMNIECEIYIDDYIVCPYSLSLLLYQENTK